MKARPLCIGIAVLLLALTGAGQDKKDSAVREFPVAGLRVAPRSDGDAMKPTAIKNAEELAKAIPDAESQAVIKKHVDFAKEQVLFFYWFGSKADKLAPTAADGKKEIVFRLLPGKTQDNHEHVKLFVLSREATWKVEPETGGKGPMPDGPAPRFFTVTEVGKDNIKFTELAIKVGRRVVIDYVPTLAEAEIYDASGKKITAEECRKRVKVGSVVLIASEPHKPDPAYLAVLKGDTIVLVPSGILDDGQPIKLGK